MSDRDWQAEFDRSYAGSPSAVQERIWREVYADEYPEGVDPYSYVSATELHRFAAELRVGEGQTCADIGCGRGGAGLWIATATGANLIGIDISANALEAARARAAAMGAQQRTEFREGSFESTELAAESVDAIMSIDALLFTPDKQAALLELRRVVRRAGRFVFTSWDYARQPVGRPPQLGDHRHALAAAGFSVLAYEETEDWHRRIAATTAGLRENVQELAAESGEDIGYVRASLDEMNATIETMSRRILVITEAR